MKARLGTLFLALVACLHATTWNSDGSVSNINTIIASGSTLAGDIITIPSGSFTWGTSGTHIDITKAITLQGAGAGSTTITLDATGPGGTAGVVRITAAATVKNFTVIPATAVAPFTCSAVNGWRITGITYTGVAEAYFCYFTSYGLIDHNNITGFSGTNELIFGNGPTDSWQTANSMGTANALYIEDCTFSGQGYVCDFNANARGVVRFCTVGGSIKVDSHGLDTNTPPRGVRQTEVYRNNWGTSGFAPQIEIRGGTGMVFQNDTLSTTSWFFLTDYGYIGGTAPNFGNVFMTPINYAIGDQIGTGQDVTIAATAITTGMMVRVITVGTTNYTLIGGTNSVGAQFVASGAGTGSGTVSHAPAAAEPMYVWSNTRSSGTLTWARELKTVAPGAITLYQSQTSNPAATFGDQDLIQSNRDIFATAGYDTNTGMQVGTHAAMLLYTPSVVGYGWWVTDEGNWNTTVTAGTSGRLYRWNGSSWGLYYTPYTYPYPTTPTVPTLTSAAIPSAGTSISVTFDQSVTFGAGGNGGMTASASGGATTLTYSSGSGTNILVYTSSRTLTSPEVVTINYTQPGDGIEGASGTLDLATFSGQSVTNNSSQGGAATVVTNRVKQRLHPNHGPL